MGTELRKLKPETITRALVALRAEMVRDGGPGLVYVEALLTLRGSNLPPVPRKAPHQISGAVSSGRPFTLHLGADR